MRADELVSSDRGIVGLAPAVLGDTWIVQSMEVAVRLAVGPALVSAFGVAALVGAALCVGASLSAWFFMPP